jgi:hypothetical protein
MTDDEIINAVKKIGESIYGMTGNERLSASGLFEEFKRAKRKDKQKAKKILELLRFDELDIARIVG